MLSVVFFMVSVVLVVLVEGTGTGAEAPGLNG
jgi:hypothetical protein